MLTRVVDGITVRPVSGSVGAEIRGLDLNERLSDEILEVLVGALNQYGVLFFSNQSIDAEAHRAFGRAFGELDLPHGRLHETLADQGLPEISVHSTENGLAAKAEVWHADVTWDKAPPRYTILHLVTLPEVGGDTMWSSQYRALEELSPQLVDMLTGMTAMHTPTIPDGREAHHPLVIEHPQTGRRALYLNHLFTQRIDQLSKLESDAILGMLKQHSVRPEFTCRWRWTKGDVAIWDNNFVQHYAIGDYEGKRAIHRVEVVGAPLTPASRA